MGTLCVESLSGQATILVQKSIQLIPNFSFRDFK
ncbi:Uncharacterised protein [Yersinia mollaretii]|uniref:Uncharacterized protein n=1 Tax=Yersinia mollaretii TaxID=33060 RepID=A0AA36LK46_YERMO|nr:Uncharacterised protein [Yersinia mollaretii]CNH71564.1 Uncharacterised protein [Yersinia mollaretii]CQJ16572.1 Uncharacterised protein [Yersinia mollaretii]